jgi:hypothetical protein
VTAPETEERLHLPAAPVPRGSVRLPAALADPVERAAYALVALSLLVWTWAASRSYFRQDDFLYLHRAVTRPLTLDSLLTGYQGHLMPGQFLLVEGLVRVAPLSWAAAVAVVLAFRLVASLAAVRLLVELFGRRPAVLAPLALFLFSPLLVLPFLWWAAALQVLTLQAAMVLAALAHVRYLRTGRTRDGVLGVLAVAGGLVFWEKALLVPLVLVGVEVMARRAGMPVAAARRRPVWLAHGLLVAGYLALYFGRVEPAGRHAGLASPGQVAELTRQVLLDGFLPGLVGGPWRGGYVGTLPPPAGAAAIVAALLVVGAVVAGTCLVRPRAALPAWLMLAGYLAFDIGLLAALRLDFIGPVIGRDPRYTADAVVVAALALGFALLPVVGARRADPAAEPVRGRLHRLTTAPRRWLAGRETPGAAAASLVLLPAYLASCLISTGLAAQHMERTSGRSFVATARAELERKPGVSVWDGQTPEDLIGSVFRSDARMSRVFAPLRTPVRWNEPTGELFLLDGLGLLRPAEMLVDARSRPGADRNCGYGLVAGRQRRIPLERVAGPGPQVIRVGYYAARPVPGTVTADLTAIRVVFQQGLHYLFVVVQGPVGRLSLGLDAAESGAGLCATEVVVGQPWPRPGT